MLLTEMVKDLKNSLYMKTKDATGKTKDDQSDKWKEEIKHLKEFLETYPDSPDLLIVKQKIKDLEDKITGTKDARDQFIEKWKGVSIWYDKTANMYWAVPEGLGIFESDIGAVKKKIDKALNFKDSKTKDSDVIININMGNEKANVEIPSQAKKSPSNPGNTTGTVYKGYTIKQEDDGKVNIFSLGGVLIGTVKSLEMAMNKINGLVPPES